MVPFDLAFEAVRRSRQQANVVKREVGSRALIKWITLMYYVYLLRSLKDPTKTYIGFTNNVEERLERHNAGRSVHTEKDRPWKLVTYLAFSSETQAISFEKYIKVGSGHAFAQKRLW